MIDRRAVLRSLLFAPIIVQPGVLMPIFVRDPRWYAVGTFSMPNYRVVWTEARNGNDGGFILPLPAAAFNHDYAIWLVQGERDRDRLIRDIEHGDPGTHAVPA